MTATKAEEIIINRLKEIIRDIPVETFPDRPEGYTLTHPVGALLVHYNNSEWEREDVNHLAVLQYREMFVNVHVKAKSLRSAKGALTLLENCIDALQGLDISMYNVTRPGRLYIQEDSFVEYDPVTGVWDYEVVVGVPTEKNQNENLN